MGSRRLLVVCQVVDSEDPVLGFFVEWIAELATRSESITVICLYAGTYTFPENVTVHSLGKEKGPHSKWVYALRFKRLAWKLRHEYEAVFVHMNQEYILIAGPMWKLLGKRVYMWRNHYAGSWLTDVAAAFCTKVFCTSKHSYTARYKKTVLMPVGVDVSTFSMSANIPRVLHSILFLARMAPSKRPDMLLEALGKLRERGIAFTASFVGSPLPEDEAYYASLKTHSAELGLEDSVLFLPAVTHAQAAEVFATHDIFVNCSRSGMFDKTIFEAAASGCLVLASSEDFKQLAGDICSFASTEELAARLALLLHSAMATMTALRASLGEISQRQSLTALAEKLTTALGSGEA